VHLGGGERREQETAHALDEVDTVHAAVRDTAEGPSHVPSGVASEWSRARPCVPVLTRR
jgi:hypothetical protein